MTPRKRSISAHTYLENSEPIVSTFNLLNGRNTNFSKTELKSDESTLLVLIDFCTVYSEALCRKNEDFDLNTGSKTQNMEGVSLDLIFHNIFW